MNIETLANTIKKTCLQTKFYMFGNCALMNNIVVNHPTREAREKVSMLSSVVPENYGSYEILTGSMAAPVIDVMKKAIENCDDRILICFRSKIYGNYNRVYVASYKTGKDVPTATATETHDDVMRAGEAEYFTVVLDVLLLSRLCNNRKIDQIMINKNEKSIVLFFAGKYSQVPITVLSCFAGHPDNYRNAIGAACDMEKLDSDANTPAILSWWLQKKTA